MCRSTSAEAKLALNFTHVCSCSVARLGIEPVHARCSGNEERSALKPRQHTIWVVAQARAHNGVAGGDGTNSKIEKSGYPELEYYHPLVKALAGERKVVNMRGESLEEISLVFACYEKENIKAAFDCFYPGRATQEDVDGLCELVEVELDKKVPDEDREWKKWVIDD